MAGAGADLGTDEIRGLLFRLALPTIASQAVNMLYNLVDRVYIGHIPEIGTHALTGVGICLPVSILISAFASLAGMGGAPRASIEMGRGNREAAERILGNCAGLLLLLSAVLTGAFLAFHRPILAAFGASGSTISYAAEFLQIYVLGTVFVQITLGLNAFLIAQGFTAASMVTVLIGAGLNLLLDPIFIFALDLGVRGAALANVLSQGASALWVLRFLTGKQTLWRLRLRNLRLRPWIILPCLGLGLSPFFMTTTDSLIAVCFNSSLLRYGGDLAVGAMTVLTSVMQFAMMPLQGLTQGAQPIVSHNFGAGSVARLREAIRLVVTSCVIYSMSLWLLVQLFPRVIIGIFTPDPALTEYTVPALRLYMGCTGIFGIQVACQQTLVALSDAGTSLFLAVLRKLVLLVPLIWLLPHCFRDPVFGVFLAEPVADGIAVAVTAALFAVQFRKMLRGMACEAGGKPGQHQSQF